MMSYTYCLLTYGIQRGVHLQDITRVNEGKTDMKDGQVNWTKFRQVRSSIILIQLAPPDLWLWLDGENGGDRAGLPSACTGDSRTTRDRGSDHGGPSRPRRE